MITKNASFAALAAFVCATAFGAYVNPIVDADMSDPDCDTADGKSFWLVTSSFTDIPGLPLYRSTDLVHWELANHALKSPPKGGLDVLLDGADFGVRGHGVWAPAIRFHDGLWYIFWGDPDRGIYRTTAKDPEEEWSEPELIKPGRGFIDPCPLWDDDGSFHLVHAYAASRAGFNSVLNLDGRIVYDGIPDGNHTIEGPKLYKRDGWYWIFAPAGGVIHGWQLALRSRSLKGPFEPRIVLRKGDTRVNGPHQGAWVRKADGSEWFLHFQDKGYAGRVLHLQPLAWSEDGWPVMGDGGNPVSASDAAGDGSSAPLAVDWVADQSDRRIFETPSGRRLYSGATYFTKIPAPSFTATANATVWAKDGERGILGLVLVGDRNVLIGLKPDTENDRFDVVLKDGDETKRLGRIPAERFSAGARTVWKAKASIVARVEPSKDNPRVGEAVLSLGEFTSKPFRIENSVWQGLKIGMTVEADFSKSGLGLSSMGSMRDPKNRHSNWLDLESFEFAVR